MEAVRLRKENQILSADAERTAILLRQQERQKRENAIMSDLRDLVVKKQKESELRHEKGYGRK